MEPPQRQPYISPQEFLEIQRTSDVPLEYMDGQILALASGTKAHGLLITSTTAMVTTALCGTPCDAIASISVKAPTSYLVPDLVVYCNGGEFTREDELLLNPTVVFEVLSDSTERYDRGPKWMRYQQIESLKHYVMISQSEPVVEVYTRETGGGWHYETVSGLDSIVTLTHLGLTLALSDVYRRVEFMGQAS